MNYGKYVHNHPGDQNIPDFFLKITRFLGGPNFTGKHRISRVNTAFHANFTGTSRYFTRTFFLKITRFLGGPNFTGKRRISRVNTAFHANFTGTSGYFTRMFFPENHAFAFWGPTSRVNTAFHVFFPGKSCSINKLQGIIH